MFKRISLISLVACLMGWAASTPATAQALLPYTLQLEPKQLEDRSLGLIQEAIALSKFQQSELAIARAELATQLSPRDYKTWFLLGSLQAEAQKWDKAIASLQKAKSLAATGDRAPVYFSIGSAYFQKGDYQGALSELQAGLKLQPDSAEALFDLGNTYFKLNRYSEAIGEYNKVIAKDAKFWAAVNNIGLVKYEQGDIEGALVEWRKAVAIDPKAAEPSLAIAIATYVRGQQTDALAQGVKAINIDRRYADPDFLKINLWGDKLLAEAKKFLELPTIREAVANPPEETTPDTETPAPGNNPVVPQG